MRSISVDDIPRFVEDTVYTAVGLGVLGFQRVQVQRQQLKRSLSSSYGEAREALDDRVRLVEERMSDLDERFDEMFESVEPRLPEPAREAARQVVTLAREARDHVFDLVELHDDDGRDGRGSRSDG
jgi:hypothetical protein